MALAAHRRVPGAVGDFHRNRRIPCNHLRRCFRCKGLLRSTHHVVPAAAATLTAFIAKTPLKVFGWNWGAWRWQLLAWLSPLVYVGIAYGLIWVVGWGNVPNPVFVADAAKSVGLHISAAGSAILLIFFSATLGMLDLAGAL